MLEYINENEYREIMGTSSVPNNFKQLDIRASNIINKKTMGRIKVIDETIKYVTALIINELDKHENSVTGNLKSTSIEGWSESYKTGSELDEELYLKIEDILQTYLWNTNLLSKGVLLYE